MTRLIATSTLVCLLAVACGGGDATTTSEGTTTTTLPGSTTVSAPATTLPPQGTGSPQGTLPPVVAQTVFAFAAGTTPRIAVTVSVGESPDGPWMPAGFFADPTPTLTSPSFWVRFDIANLDSLGLVTDVDISGIDGSVLGEDVCALAEPLPVGGSGSCVIGDFPVEDGGAQNDFTAIGAGQRQGTEAERFFDPPIPTAVGYDGYRHGFILIFDNGGGIRVDGTSDGDEIEVSAEGLDLSGPIRVDCSDLYPGGLSSTGGSPSGGEPPLVAYVIGNFGDSGEPSPGCTVIPQVDLVFDLDGSSDTAFLYETGAPTTTTSTGVTTTTAPATTTTAPATTTSST